MDPVGMITGLLCGAAFVYLLMRSRLVKMDREKAILEERGRHLADEMTAMTGLLKDLDQKILEKEKRLEAAIREYASLQGKYQAEREEHENQQKRQLVEFENLANKILEKNSEKFTSLNQKNIGSILDPLQEKLRLFEKKVEDTYVNSAKDRSSLQTEIKRLYELNHKISEEASNLTKALKGDVKKQGNWGEFVLERILERSGLSRDSEYKTQFSSTNADGHRIQPDAVVFLPDDKHIIIDAKVSLVAYERFIASQDDAQRQLHLREHISSIRSHVKSLSDKKYQSADGLHAPDFILMFIPIESSFSLAVQGDLELFNFAWEHSIVIVSPSTLLATLKTVESIWKQEKQTRNAMEIARQGGALYDKFVGFLDDLSKIERHIDQAKGAYTDAVGKLQTGKGNLVARIENIKRLGVKTSKQIPTAFLPGDEEDDVSTER